MSRLPWDQFTPVRRASGLLSADPDHGYAAVLQFKAEEPLRFWSSSEAIVLRSLEGRDQEHWTPLLGQAEDRFFWELLADAGDLPVLEIGPGTLEKPLLVHWLHTGSDERRYNERMQLIVHPGAVAHVIVRLDSRNRVFLNSGLNVWIGEGAVFRLTQIQSLTEDSFWVDHGFSRQRPRSTFHYTRIDLGSDTSKTKFVAAIEGDHAELQAKGLYLCHGRQHKDLRLVQRHLAPESLSNALFKGAVKDRGRSVFQGLIQVSKDGHKTDAYLSNKNLVLNDGARADSLPQLQIDHNDLRCTHGSTTGMVDEEQVHYLQSRGLSKTEAKVLIAMGLFQEIIDGLPEPLRLPVEGQVEQSLKTDG